MFYLLFGQLAVTSVAVVKNHKIVSGALVFMEVNVHSTQMVNGKKLVASRGLVF